MFFILATIFYPEPRTISSKTQKWCLCVRVRAFVVPGRSPLGHDGGGPGSGDPGP